MSDIQIAPPPPEVRQTLHEPGASLVRQPRKRRKADRRIERSRHLLLDAMQFLMAERSYDDFTVTDILDRAGVARATFYAHFRGKEALLIGAITQLKHHLLARSDGAEPSENAGRLGFAGRFFAYVDGHRAVFGKILASQGDESSYHLRRMLRELIVTDPALPQGVETNSEVSAAVEYVVGALWALTRWWLESKSTARADDLAVLFRRLSINALDAATAEVP